MRTIDFFVVNGHGTFVKAESKKINTQKCTLWTPGNTKRPYSLTVKGKKPLEPMISATTLPRVSVNREERPGYVIPPLFVFNEIDISPLQGDTFDWRDFYHRDKSHLRWKELVPMAHRSPGDLCYLIIKDNTGVFKALTPEESRGFAKKRFIEFRATYVIDRSYTRSNKAIMRNKTF